MLRQRLKQLRPLPPDRQLRELLTLARTGLDERTPDDWSRLGRALNSLAPEVGSLPTLTLLGQCTLDYLSPVVAGRTLEQRLPCRTEVGAYDQALQAIQQVDTDLVVLVPWRERLVCLESELDYWTRCWETAQRRGLGIVQLGYDWPEGNPSGHLQAPGRAVAELNRQLREELPEGAFFLDLDLISGREGRRHFYDTRSYRWTKQPWSELGLSILARHIAAAARTLLCGPKKLIAVDLDNTLWGGEVGELGWAGVVLHGPEGEAHLALGRALKELKDRGVLLAVTSKNELENARAAFENRTDLPLAWDDFVAHQVHWRPKSESLKAIAEELSLGLDSFVFLDDNPRERAEIEQVLPEVAVLPLPQDPYDYRNALIDSLLFESTSVTREDRQRTESYRRRREARSQEQTVEQYLSELEMVAEIAPLEPETLARTAQLVAKTNQFNLTTRRHSVSALDALARIPGAYFRTLTLRDRLGDLGLISVLIAVPSGPDELEIDTWLMSCRALGRTVEHAFFRDLLQFASDQGVTTLVGRYLPTEKNRPVSELLAQLGFERCPDEETRWVLNIETASRPESFVERRTPDSETAPPAGQRGIGDELRK